MTAILHSSCQCLPGTWFVHVTFLPTRNSVRLKLVLLCLSVYCHDRSENSWPTARVVYKRANANFSLMPMGKRFLSEVFWHCDTGFVIGSNSTLKMKTGPILVKMPECVHGLKHASLFSDS